MKEFGEPSVLKSDLDDTQAHLDQAHRDFKGICEQRDQAQACLAQALAEQYDLTNRVFALEDDVRTLEHSRENLTDIADGLRDELRDLRAAVTIGAARKKGKR